MPCRYTAAAGGCYATTSRPPTFSQLLIPCARCPPHHLQARTLTLPPSRATLPNPIDHHSPRLRAGLWEAVLPPVAPPTSRQPEQRRLAFKALFSLPHPLKHPVDEAYYERPLHRCSQELNMGVDAPVIRVADDRDSDQYQHAYRDQSDCTAQGDFIPSFAKQKQRTPSNCSQSLDPANGPR